MWQQQQFKSYLIIDDFAQFRMSLKGMLQSFGAEKIDQAASGAQAVKMISANHYDVVLADYNLGELQDGQQILEEVRTTGALKASSLFIMLTAESNFSMVMGAIEYEPDAYIAKPFTATILRGRLEKIFSKYLENIEIHRAVDKKQYEKAMQLCDEKIANNGKNSMHCYRIKANLLFQAKQYLESLKVCQQVLDKRKIPWATLQAGKNHFQLQEFEQSKAYFLELIEQNSTFIEAYDWLAKIEKHSGNFVKAQQAVEAALKVSDKSVRRQMSWGDLAISNNDLDSATKAFRKSVSLAEHSCFKTKDNYLKLTDSLLKQSEKIGGLKGKKAALEALSVNENLRQSYKNDKVALLSSRMLDSDVFKKLGRDRESKEALTRAHASYKQLDGQVEPEIAQLLFDHLLKAGEDKLADTILRDQIAQGHIQPEQVVRFEEQIAQHSALNNEGVRKYKAGLFDQAFNDFKQAAAMHPKNISINLNAAQAAIKKLQQHPSNYILKKFIKTYFMNVNGIQKNDYRYKRYVELVRKVKQIENK